jgi:hypothetical protein
MAARTCRRSLTLAALTLALGAVSARADFTHYSPPDPQKVDFVVNCFKVKTGYFDPIVFPGQSNVSHKHIFFGNLGIGPSSTPWTLGNGGAGQTNCELSRNRSSYWSPVTMANGVDVYPHLPDGTRFFELRAYYRAGTTNLASLNPVPFGLRVIAGNAAATASSPQSAGVAGFQCRNLTDGNTVPKQNTPPACASGDYMEESVVFPNCWDGTHLDSADHKSHMSYASATAACDAAHPRRLPQVTLAERFPVNAFLGKQVTLATKALAGESAAQTAARSVYTLHADAMFAWDPATMSALVTNCLKASIGCEGMRDDRLPPSMNGQLPADTTPPASAAPRAGGAARTLRAVALHCRLLAARAG